ncbi:hypothetical protein FB451DRAFT_1563845 [Mycena latifolia]|nr:hypothetical protein FB451DRAFT_1563845 [Mycena latifolia]
MHPHPTLSLDAPPGQPFLYAQQQGAGGYVAFPSTGCRSPAFAGDYAHWRREGADFRYEGSIRTSTRTARRSTEGGKAEDEGGGMGVGMEETGAGWRGSVPAGWREGVLLFTTPCPSSSTTTRFRSRRALLAFSSLFPRSILLRILPRLSSPSPVLPPAGELDAPTSSLLRRTTPSFILPACFRARDAPLVLSFLRLPSAFLRPAPSSLSFPSFSSFARASTPATPSPPCPHPLLLAPRASLFSFPFPLPPPPASLLRRRPKLLPGPLELLPQRIPGGAKYDSQSSYSGHSGGSASRRTSSTGGLFAVPAQRAAPRVCVARPVRPPHPHDLQHLHDLHAHNLKSPPEFSSAFGLMSLDGPNVLAGLAPDGVPLFSRAHPQTPHGQGGEKHMQLAPPLACQPYGSTPGTREAETRELREFWQAYMRTPLTDPSPAARMPSPGLPFAGISNTAALAGDKTIDFSGVRLSLDLGTTRPGVTLLHRA